MRAKMVRNAWDYPWCSAGAHVGSKTPPAWLEMKRWCRWTDAEHWKKELRKDSQEAIEAPIPRWNEGRNMESRRDKALKKRPFLLIKGLGRPRAKGERAPRVG